jgi:hypothetical protein
MAQREKQLLVVQYLDALLMALITPIIYFFLISPKPNNHAGLKQKILV